MSLEPEIRSAVPGDELELARIGWFSWRATYRGLIPDPLIDALTVERREAGWRTVLAAPEGKLVFVLERDGAAVGYASGGTTREEGEDQAGIGELHTLYLLPECQRGGLGTALLEHTLAALRAQGFNETRLWCLSKNRPASRFYRARGFQELRLRVAKSLSGVPLDHDRLGRRL